MPKTPKQRVRLLAVAAARREDGRLLVQRGSDPTTGEPFHRLVGGGVDFGETVAQALARELHEELGTRARVGEVLVWHENLFELGGVPGHEVVVVCDTTLDDPAVTGRDELGHIPGSDSTVHWLPVEEVLDGPVRFVPEAIRPVLRAWCSGPREPRHRR